MPTGPPTRELIINALAVRSSPAHAFFLSSRVYMWECLTTTGSDCGFPAICFFSLRCLITSNINKTRNQINEMNITVKRSPGLGRFANSVETIIDTSRTSYTRFYLSVYTHLMHMIEFIHGLNYNIRNTYIS